MPHVHMTGLHFRIDSEIIKICLKIMLEVYLFYVCYFSIYFIYFETPTKYNFKIIKEKISFN